ncbi:TerB family tellurite resistance protein [Rhizobium sp. FKL33]|uniref:tellurite resistance TerB family protein n=1 Tax=Rhizobium sp. FKL33 TaxID=2562307 RepID=UPI001484CDA1|nr:TerB family tellurite resistance protein [Rhizobium sp. FKL33]
MFEKLMGFLHALSGETPKVEPDSPAVAVIALALSVIQADGVVKTAEEQMLEKVIRDYFNLSGPEFRELLATARQQEEEAVDFFRFTSRINKELDERQKLEFIGMLWQIVHADHERNELEDHLIWRIAELIGVSGRDRVTKRMEVERRLDESGETS